MSERILFEVNRVTFHHNGCKETVSKRNGKNPMRFDAEFIRLLGSSYADRVDIDKPSGQTQLVPQLKTFFR